jgi:hypothetical protein
VAPPLCSTCLSGLEYDEWEDCYLCPKCGRVFYPTELGLPENPDAGIYHLGDR